MVLTFAIPRLVLAAAAAATLAAGLQLPAAAAVAPGNLRGHG
ncbi:MAG: hypothetical protein ACR2KK_10795 [Acidimicrobiales bacterium]